MKIIRELLEPFESTKDFMTYAALGVGFVAVGYGFLWVAYLFAPLLSW